VDDEAAAGGAERRQGGGIRRRFPRRCSTPDGADGPDEAVAEELILCEGRSILQGSAVESELQTGMARPGPSSSEAVSPTTFNGSVRYDVLDRPTQFIARKSRMCPASSELISSYADGRRRVRIAAARHAAAQPATHSTSTLREELSPPTAKKMRDCEDARPGLREEGFADEPQNPTKHVSPKAHTHNNCRSSLLVAGHSQTKPATQPGKKREHWLELRAPKRGGEGTTASSSGCAGLRAPIGAKIIRWGPSGCCAAVPGTDVREDGASRSPGQRASWCSRPERRSGSGRRRRPACRRSREIFG
ncbi:hypothetical protein THAOC_14598, partial [Thalassiosira oceanica]